MLKIINNTVSKNTSYFKKSQTGVSIDQIVKSKVILRLICFKMYCVLVKVQWLRKLLLVKK